MYKIESSDVHKNDKVGVLLFAGMYTANQISDWLLSKIDTEKGDVISHLNLQKLIYYAQAWHYTIFGEKIFDERIEAWMNGPAVQSVYDRFKHIPKYNAIPIAEINPPELPSKSHILLSEVLELYGEHSGPYLERLTHSEDPWIIARGNLQPHERCNTEITLQSMKDYYSRINGQQSS